MRSVARSVAIVVLLASPCLGQATRRTAPVRPLLVRIDSVQDVFAGTTTVTVKGEPVLSLNTSTSLWPEWTCEANAPCTLLGLHVKQVMSKQSALDVRDEEAAEAAWAENVKSVYLDWDFVVITPTDTVRFNWAVDSLTYVSRNVRTRKIYANGTIRDERILQAFAEATTVRIRQRWRIAGAERQAPFEVDNTAKWLQRLQASHRRVTTGRQPTASLP